MPATKTIFLTSGTTLVVPHDWRSDSNIIEVIGGGADGSAGGSNGGNARHANPQTTMCYDGARRDLAGQVAASLANVL
jgi:hypothetical protein